MASLVRFLGLVCAFLSCWTFAPVRATGSDTRYAAVFDAIDHTPHHSVDLELLGGTLRAFQTFQEDSRLRMTDRFDLLPIGQARLLREAGREPTLLPVTIENATFEGIIDACVSHPRFADLAIYEPKLGAMPFVRVRLSRSEPLVFRVGKDSLTLAPEVLRYLSVNAKFSATEAGGNRLVAVVHEPHSSRMGQFQLIEALKILFRDPLHRDVMFLMEGDYWDSDRNIPLEPWNATIGHGPWAAPAIRQLVYDYVIDGAFAARLLRSHGDIPSYSIDDNALLQQMPRKPDSRALLAAIGGLKLSKSDRDGLRGLALRVSQIRDVNEYSKIADRIARVQPSRPAAEQKVLGLLSDLVTSYSLSTLRDATMVKEIERRLHEHPNALPFVFIGNFHTPGVLTALRADDPNIRFVVLDVRGLFEDRGDHEAFEDAIQGKLPGSAGRKLAVSPHPRFESWVRRRVAEVQSDTRQAMEQAAGDPRIVAMLEGHPALARLRVQAGGANPPPPPEFSRAFASFYPEPNGPRGTLSIYDINSPGWNAPEARLKAIELISAAPAPFDAVLQRAHWHIDGRVFVVFSDRDSRRHYLFEQAQAGGTLDKLAIRLVSPDGAELRLQDLADMLRKLAKTRS